MKSIPHEIVAFSVSPGLQRHEEGIEAICEIAFVTVFAVDWLEGLHTNLSIGQPCGAATYSGFGQGFSTPKFHLLYRIQSLCSGRHFDIHWRGWHED